MISNKLFGKYDLSEINVSDPSLKKYVFLNPVFIPHSFGHHGKKQFAKAKVNVIERFINKLMRGGTGKKVLGRVIRTHGQLQGKKLKLINRVEKAFEIIEKRTGQNPVQVFVDALTHAAPREEVTRVSYGGVSYQIAVDVSASRRLDVALRNMALASLISSFDNKKTLAEAIADEVISASKGDAATSYAIKKKDETERIARSAR